MMLRTPWMVLLALGAAFPAAATTYTFTFNGSVTFTPPKFGPQTIYEVGSGQFSVDPALASPSLANGLTDFSFSVAVTGYGGATYDLADLTGFTATQANGQITSLSFFTRGKTNGSYSSAGFFDNNGSAIDFCCSGPSPFGTVVVSGAVPEPRSWLTMLAGFGLIGAALRLRSRRPERPLQKLIVS